MSKKTLLMVLAVSLLAAPLASAADQALNTEDEKTLYAMGLAMARRVSTFGLTESEVKFIEQGLADGILGKDPKVDLQTYGPLINKFLEAKQATQGEAEKARGAAFLEKMAGEPGAVKTDSGMIYFEETAGTGASPGATDKVQVHYHGTFSDGRVFDSSRDGNPVTFGLDRVVACFSEGIQRMKVGGKSKLVCPADLAYGDRGSPGSIPPGATLVFEIELLDIVSNSPTSKPVAPVP